MKTLTITISDDAASKLLRLARKWQRTREAMATIVISDCIGADWYDEPDMSEIEPDYDYLDDPENPRPRPNEGDEGP